MMVNIQKFYFQKVEKQDHVYNLLNDTVFRKKS